MKYIVDRLPITKEGCPNSEYVHCVGDIVYDPPTYICKYDYEKCDLDRDGWLANCRWLRQNLGLF